MILSPTAHPLHEPLPRPPATLDPIADDPSGILARISRGDAGALGSFYDRWEAPVHAFVARLIRDSDARDRVMEAIFWAVWEGAASYDATPVDQWMHALTVACCKAELEQHVRVSARNRLRGLPSPVRLPDCNQRSA